MLAVTLAVLVSATLEHTEISRDKTRFSGLLQEIGELKNTVNSLAYASLERQPSQNVHEKSSTTGERASSSALARLRSKLRSKAGKARKHVHDGVLAEATADLSKERHVPESSKNGQKHLMKPPSEKGAADQRPMKPPSNERGGPSQKGAPGDQGYIRRWRPDWGHDVENLAEPTRKVTAVKEMPESMRDRFLMHGRAETMEKYYDDVQNMGDKSPVREVFPEQVDALIEKARQRKQKYYGMTDQFLYNALDKFKVKGQDVVVMGSQKPWYEAIALERGAKKVTVIEYQKVESQDPRISYLTPEDYYKVPYANRRKFDAAIAISSFEHDGLGRYGEDLDPDADIKAMHRMQDTVKPGGLLFLAVPIGKDCLVWNAHRIYGQVRLPMLTQGWERVGTEGFKEESLEKGGCKTHYQPVMVFKNREDTTAKTTENTKRLFARLLGGRSSPPQKARPAHKSRGNKKPRFPPQADSLRRLSD